jgi:hypothetical protein
MTEQRQFALGYLFWLVFWWAMVFAIAREITYPPRGSDIRLVICVLLSLPVFGAALGGLVLRIRFGFIAGLCISAPFWIVFAYGMVARSLSN